MGNETSTIGILYAGEMGAALGSLLRADGVHVVTTCHGRSARTESLCRRAGLHVLATLRETVAAADVIISLVPPGAALELAEQVTAAAYTRTRPLLYVDANSVSPDTISRIASLFETLPIELVDMAIHGLASRLQEHGTVYVSGRRAGVVEQLFAGRIRVKVLDETLGRASLLKMLLGGMSKGLVALFLEMSRAARHADLLDEYLTECQQYYAGVMTVIERLLPTYPQHARRRGEEMRELEQTLVSLGITPELIPGIRRVITALGEKNLQQLAPSKLEPRSAKDLIALMYPAVQPRHSAAVSR